MLKTNLSQTIGRDYRSGKPCHKRKVIYIKVGQLCPHCGFARLQKEPGGIIRCPVCGFGPNIKFT